MRQEEIEAVYESMGIGSDADREKLMVDLNGYFAKDPKEYYFIQSQPTSDLPRTENAELA